MHSPAVFHLPMAIPFWAVFFLAFVREAKVFRPAIAEKPSEQDAGTLRALLIASPLMVLVAIAVAFLPWLTIAHEALAVGIGIALVIVGAALRRYCFYALGTSFTGAVSVKANQEVVRTGPYRYVRHPSYTAALFVFTGIGVALGSWLSVAVLFLSHAYLYGKRVAAEERALVETLGGSYSDYMMRTKRFIPFVI